MLPAEICLITYYYEGLGTSYMIIYLIIINYYYFIK